ncbi:NUDIX hydrolase [bacterium]|nr:NUDIX hydrolase [bacterium]
MQKHPWKKLGRRTLVKSVWLKHHLDTVRLPSGKTIMFHALDFPRKVAGVIPVGDDGRVLLTRQYRYMAKSYSWEMPAGNVPRGETVMKGALRELEEETGYTARRIKLLYTFHPQIGRSNHLFHLFVATGLRKVSATYDTDEVSEIRWFSVRQLQAMVRRQEFIDGFTLLGLLLWGLQGKGPRKRA